MLKSTIVKWAAAGIAGVSTAYGSVLPTNAAETERLKLRYDVLVKGLQVFDIKYDANLSGSAYNIDVKMKPTGFAGLFVNRKMTMTASGAVKADRASPKAFRYISKKKKKKSVYSVTWNGQGIADTQRSRPLSKYKTQAVARALKPRLPDPLTTLLRSAVTETPCTHKERVYNGAEIYDLSFELIGKERLRSDDVGVYRGTTYKCRMTYVPVAGLSKNKQAKYSDNPAQFTVWFAPVASRALGRKLFLPIAASGKIKDNTFVAYTRHASISDRPFNAKSVASR